MSETTTLTVQGKPYPWHLERLDFVTREEFVETYAQLDRNARRREYILAGMLAQGADLPIDPPPYAMDPVVYGRACYSQLRTLGVERLSIIRAGNAAILAATEALWPSDDEVADRQDFTNGARAT